MSFLADLRIKIIAIVAVLAALAGAVVYAQLEGIERGVAPLASTGDFEVMGIEVDVRGDNGFDARQKGWQQAQREAWKILYERTQGAETSGLPDSRLNTIVSAIIVEQEQIGPKRYIATLGVMFDRARAGSILGVDGRRLRSPPLLVLPIMFLSVPWYYVILAFVTFHAFTGFHIALIFQKKLPGLANPIPIDSDTC